jgi:hypothetical protein
MPEQKLTIADMLRQGITVKEKNLKNRTAENKKSPRLSFVPGVTNHHAEGID